MKRILFFLFVSLLVSGTMYSQSLENEATPSNSTTTEQLVSTFYGSKLSSNSHNPCKGATIRVCGTIEWELITENSAQTRVVKQIKDADGTVLSVSDFFVAKPLKAVKGDIIKFRNKY